MPAFGVLAFVPPISIKSYPQNTIDNHLTNAAAGGVKSLQSVP